MDAYPELPRPIAPHDGWPETDATRRAAIVPVELRVAGGTWFTLWQRWWDADGEVGGPFLGDDDLLYAAARPDELAAFVHSGAEHELRPSRAWPDVAHWTVADLTPAAADRYDLSEAPGPEDGARLIRTAHLVEDLASFLLLETALDGVDVSTYAAVPALLTGPLGGRRREELAQALAAALPEIALAVRLHLSEPPADTAGPPADTAGPPADSAGAPLAPVAASAGAPLAPVALEQLVDAEVLWLGLDGLTGYAVRRRADPERDPVFLGEPGVLLLAPDIDTLQALLGSGEVAPFPGERPWPEIAATGDLEPYEDAVYDLDGLGESIGTDLGRDDALALLDAQLLLLDLADWCGTATVRAELEQDRPLGRFLVAVVPEVAQRSLRSRGRLEATDLDAVRAAWWRCLAELADRVSARR